MLIVTISRTSRHFSLVAARSRSLLHMAEAVITFSYCLVFSFIIIIFRWLEEFTALSIFYRRNSLNAELLFKIASMV